MGFVADLFWIALICAVLGVVVGVAISSLRGDDYDGPAACRPKRASRVALGIARLHRTWKR